MSTRKRITTWIGVLGLALSAGSCVSIVVGAEGREHEHELELETDHERERASAGRRAPVDEHRQHEREHEREGIGPEALADRAARVEVLRWARSAHAEAGREESARRLAQAVRVGELQLEHGADFDVSQAARGLSMGILIEHLQAASALYREWGWEGRAASCNDLAEFYARREREREPAQPGERPRGSVNGSDGPEHHDDSSDARFEELRRQAEELQRELDRIRSLLPASSVGG